MVDTQEHEEVEKTPVGVEEAPVMTVYDTNIFL